MNVQQILKDENVLMDEECGICYNNFVNVNFGDYDMFLENIKNKYDLSGTIYSTIEDYACMYEYDDKFKCITCNNIICRRCVMKLDQCVILAKYNEYETSNSGIRELTQFEIDYIEQQGYDIKKIVYDDNSKEISNIPDMVINNTLYYGYMKGYPGEDCDVICPFCRQVNEV